ncbi:MAG: hypothetical protein RLZZ501_1037 [Pseudomonadota bacterium]
MAYRREGIKALHPFTLIATGFGVGLLPKAPGTWGSLLALPLAWGLAAWGGQALLAQFAAGLFLVGWFVARDYVGRSGVQDPPEVVVDEVVGQWLVLVAAPLNPVSYAVGFVLFRLFDIWKPGPIGWLERKYDSGLGVMIDDVAAGVAGLIGMILFQRFVAPLLGLG